MSTRNEAAGNCTRAEWTYKAGLDGIGIVTGLLKGTGNRCRLDPFLGGWKPAQFRPFNLSEN